MNLLDIHYFADCKLWKEELEEKYTSPFKVLKGLTKNQLHEVSTLPVVSKFLILHFPKISLRSKEPPLFAQTIIISAENNLLSVTDCVTNIRTLVFINSCNTNRKNKMTIRTIIFAQKLAF